MIWDVEFLPEAEKDLDHLSKDQQIRVKKAIGKVRSNPLPQKEGGFGKPLGHKHGLHLTNLLKVKLRGDGIRIVYKVIRTETKMLVIVIGIREDEEVYEIANRRKQKHDL